MEKITKYLSEKKIHDRIEELAEELAGKLAEESSKGKEKRIEAVVVLQGALPFYTALEKELKMRMVTVHPHYIKVKSYQGRTSTGEVHIVQDIGDIDGKKLWIIEDIIDIGYTMHFVRDHLLKKGAESVRICALLHKKAKTRLPVVPDLVGFEVPDTFLVGFGLDCDGKHRELPYIGVLER